VHVVSEKSFLVRQGRKREIPRVPTELGRDARDFTLTALPDEKALFRYDMHTLPSEISDRIGTSTL